jgi:serine/threonine-protein kinase
VTDAAHLATALAGRYAIERELGAGGMATVYLAHDVKHDRRVALKVLRPEVAAALGPVRFLREIGITSRLNHPRILPLLDSGEAGGQLYYAMPYVEGESLRQRLTREGPLPLEDALSITRAVASALSYAHALGFVHRDIKPDNVLLAGDEAVVADFGIARALSEAGRTKLTESGLAVGTAAYMSPEQAAAEPHVDGRSDIYALGCVAYEMLAGEPPYTGPTLQAITARKLTDPVPSLATIRESVPAGVESAIRRALARSPADRYQTAQQFADALALAVSPPLGQAAAMVVGVPAALPPAHSWWRATLPWGLVLLLAAGLGAILVMRRRPDAVNDPVTRFTIHPPPGDSVDFRSLVFRTDWGIRDVGISPDGRRVVFVGVHAGDTTSRLYLREMDGEATRLIAGTNGATAPFFSPDGEWVGYFNVQDGKLMKVPARGGQPQAICECGLSSGADWGADGWIVMDPGTSRQLTGLLKVRETGGRPEPVPVTDSTFSSQLWALAAPQILPDGKTVLVTLYGGGNPRIVAISLSTGRRTDIQDNAFMGRYVDPGYLLYAKLNELWAVRFDLRRLRTSGQPVRVVDSVLAGLGAWAEYAVSRTGTLVYHTPVNMGDGANRLVWVDRNDRVEPIPGSPLGNWNAARLSPDGSRILLWGKPRGSTGNSRVWLFDRTSGARPITDEGSTSAWPIFAPDGRHIVSNSNREGGGKFPLFWMALDGGDKPERLTTTEVMNQPSSWTPDGKTLAYQQGIDPKTKYDLYTVSMTGDHTVKPLIVTQWNEREPAFSPDGRWLAYVSDESGRDEVYLRRYPALDAPLKVSENGGEAPGWSADGREIFFSRGAGIFVVPFHEGQPGHSIRLVDGTQRGSRNLLDPPVPYGRNYDLTPDGRRFLMLQEMTGVPNGGEYHVVLNWFTDLRARFSPAR